MMFAAVTCLALAPRHRDVLMWVLRARRRHVRLGRLPAWIPFRRRFHAAH